MGLIVAPWDADARPRRPEGFAIGVSVVAPRVEAPDDPPARGPDASDARRERGPSPRFLSHAADDLDLARDLGCTLLSLSVSWARLQPDGRGPLRADAVAAYRRVVEGAMARGMRPLLTLCRHDPPGEGWMAPDMARRFADYAEVVALRFGDVDAILPLHEPARDVLDLAGAGAPPAEAARVLATAWRLGSEAIASACAVPIGLGVELATAFPATSSPDDGAAARFAEAATTSAWLALAAADPGALLARLTETTALPPERARGLAAIDSGCGVPAGLLVLRPRAPERVAASRRSSFAWDAAPAPPAGWQPWVPLATAWSSLPARDPMPRLLVATDAGLPTPDALAAESAAWREALAAGVPLGGWIAGDLLDGVDPVTGRLGPGGFVGVDPATGARTLRDGGRALRRIVEEWA